MAIVTTMDVTNFCGVGVIQTSNKEDEVIVTRMGELIVCVNSYIPLLHLNVCWCCLNCLEQIDR